MHNLPDPSTIKRLRHYESLLKEWQEKINLVSPATIKQAWERHFEDSFQILPLLPEGEAVLYDVGSGAGFPGLVLAICRSDISVTLIDSDTKKGVFCRNVSRETSAGAKIVTSRIEAAADTLPAPDIITARALAPLKDLLALTQKWWESNQNIKLIFLKGVRWEEELETALLSYDFAWHTAPSRTEDGSVIFVVTDVRNRSAA